MGGGGSPLLLLLARVAAPPASCAPRKPLRTPDPPLPPTHTCCPALPPPAPRHSPRRAASASEQLTSASDTLQSFNGGKTILEQGTYLVAHVTTDWYPGVPRTFYYHDYFAQGGSTSQASPAGRQAAVHVGRWGCGGGRGGEMLQGGGWRVSDTAWNDACLCRACAFLGRVGTRASFAPPS